MSSTGRLQIRKVGSTKNRNSFLDSIQVQVPSRFRKYLAGSARLFSSEHHFTLTKLGQHQEGMKNTFKTTSTQKKSNPEGIHIKCI
jgi:hypothetical protein